MSTFNLINYFPKSKKFDSIFQRYTNIENPYLVAKAINSDIDIQTIKSNELHYYFYISNNFLLNTSYDQIIDFFENAINNKICSDDVPVFISSQNQVTEYTWLNDNVKSNLSVIVTSKFNNLYSFNFYYANKTN
jgi:hypothetical protein